MKSAIHATRNKIQQQATPFIKRKQQEGCKSTENSTVLVCKFNYNF